MCGIFEFTRLLLSLGSIWWKVLKSFWVEILELFRAFCCCWSPNSFCIVQYALESELRPQIDKCYSNSNEDETRLLHVRHDVSSRVHEGFFFLPLLTYALMHVWLNEEIMELLYFFCVLSRKNWWETISSSETQHLRDERLQQWNVHFLSSFVNWNYYFFHQRRITNWEWEEKKVANNLDFPFARVWVLSRRTLGWNFVFWLLLPRS